MARRRSTSASSSSRVSAVRGTSLIGLEILGAIGGSVVRPQKRQSVAAQRNAGKPLPLIGKLRNGLRLRTVWLSRKRQRNGAMAWLLG
ncbi:hypothetical protein thsps117_23970 [Pseudomonas sp. No.117]